MKVQNFEHKNQFIITDRGNIFFQSYKSLIAKIDRDKKVTLYHDWDYSHTTMRHLYRLRSAPRLSFPVGILITSTVSVLLRVTSSALRLE